MFPVIKMWWLDDVEGIAKECRRCSVITAASFRTYEGTNIRGHNSTDDHSDHFVSQLDRGRGVGQIPKLNEVARKDAAAISWRLSGDIEGQWCAWLSFLHLASG